ncbi:MAG: cobalt-zinc-cadmium resistance protein [Acidobacteria bacterium]|nr:MAG: cobalt-zinc-cadmium resistance protein [Acidobacteriota bacterium]
MKDNISRGPIAWMATNRVTANLMMLTLLLGGITLGLKLKQEVFPEFTLDIVSVSIAYPGASPAEVENGIILAVEEAVRGLDGIKEINSTASEGFGVVRIELISGFDGNTALQNIKSAVDRIATFPVEVEKKTVSLMTRQRSVVSLVVYGDAGEAALRKLAEDIRSDLLEDPNVTVVKLTGVRNPEISIEVKEATLRAYGLTLQQIAGIISQSSLELPAGKVKAAGGEIMLRTSNRRYFAEEFTDIPIISQDDGTVVLLGDIAVIRETFEESDVFSYFMGQQAAVLNIYRVGDQTPKKVAQVVSDKVDQLNQTLPEGLHVAIWNDMSEVLQSRMELLFKNAFMGLVLVLLLLGLFLDVRLAFWVTLGIPTSILGAMLFMPAMSVSINMISLFAFIVTIGVVVDDAIVVGEHIYTMRQKGMPFLEASIRGAQEMAMPVTYSILTNIVAFIPLFFIPGLMGKVFFVIPCVVVTVFMISLFEAVFVLPAHLSHGKTSKSAGFLERQRRAVGKGLQRFVTAVYKPSLEFILKWRYATVAAGITLLLITGAIVASSKLPFVFFPRVEADVVRASLALPIGTPVEQTEKVQKYLETKAREIIAENGGDDVLRGLLTRVGMAGSGDGAASVAGGHQASVNLFFVPVDERSFTAEEFVKRWRERVGEIAGIESLSFSYSTGPHGGLPVHVELTHKDTGMLERAAADLAARLTEYAGLTDINDGFSAGKLQWDFNITQAGRSTGLTSGDVARQVRHAFYGAEAVRNQRDRDEVKVFVRLPSEDRKSIHQIRELQIQTPAGGQIPISEAVRIEEGRAYTVIKRRDGHRVLNIMADVEAGAANARLIRADLESKILPDLLKKYPGLSYSARGESKDQAETMGALTIGFSLALFGIFALLAIPFGSYSQPFIIMFSIPFGMVGAVFGHMIMGYELSLMSMMGVTALSGVVVNDALVLIVAANRNYLSGMTHMEAIIHAGTGRFRPIILTSLTTFFGLAPMIMESSVQARFLIPMAISLGFGILFSTFIVLVLVPSLYLILEDLKQLLSSFKRWITGKETVPALSEAKN